MLIDNPGMREVGIADPTSGLEITFDMITRLSQNCKFKDCTHTNEIGCSVIEAVEKGEIDRASYKNYLKLEREKTYFESSAVKRRKKDKGFGKIVRNTKKTSIGKNEVIRKEARITNKLYAQTLVAMSLKKIRFKN